MRISLFVCLGGMALLAGCMNGSTAPTADIRVTVEPRSFYGAERISVRSVNGSVAVSGELSLVNGYSLPGNFFAHVRILASDGRELADAPALLNRVDARYRGDPRLEAMFFVETKIPQSEAASVEVTFDRWPGA